MNLTFPNMCLHSLVFLILFFNIISSFSNAEPLPSNKNVIDTVTAEDTNSITEDFQDIHTPVGVQLRGIYKRSSAYRIVKDRMPTTLSQIINSLNYKREEIIQHFGKSSDGELKRVINFISNLKNEMVNNKPLVPLICCLNLNNASCSNVKIWNDILDERIEVQGKFPKWYNDHWIFVEDYMFQRITEAFRLTKTLKNFDPFGKQKKDSFDNSIDSIILVASYTLGQINRTIQEISSYDNKSEFTKLLRLCLWGNRRDLSFSDGVANNQFGNPLELLSNLDKDILVDHTEHVWNLLANKRSTTNGTITIDVVLDNAGYEFFTDLCLASFLVNRNLAEKIRFYVKRIPWYISDVTIQDFHWTIERMKESSNSNLVQFGNIISDYLKTDVMSIEEESFWTSPFVYSEMSQRDPILYDKLSAADLIIFKGDLNYRKLIGDINWEHTTSFLQAVRGFLPTNILSIRTVKADVCVGLKPGQSESLNRTNPNWMLTGQYGLIQSTIVVS